jgi:hypothetical protein
MNAKAVIFGPLMALAVAPVLAQPNNVGSVFGTVEQVDASSISVRNDQGGAVESFRLAPDLLVFRNSPATLADIRPNDFVASAAVRGTDGKLHSTELRIFAESMRGQGEGQRPMNDARSQTMTNATVTGAAIRNGSNDLMVRFPGGDSELIVDPGIPITRIDAADRSLVKSGVKVRVQGVRNADGAIVNRITIQ